MGAVPERGRPTEGYEYAIHGSGNQGNVVRRGSRVAPARLLRRPTPSGHPGAPGWPYRDPASYLKLHQGLDVCVTYLGVGHA